MTMNALQVCGSLEPAARLIDAVIWCVGSYCATTSEQEPCPAGSYCPAGSTAAKQCPAGAYCPGDLGYVQVLGDSTVNTNTISFTHKSDYSVLNTGNFALRVTVTPTNDAYPRSYCPFYFSTNPTSASTIGLSIGEDQSMKSLAVSMSDGHHHAWHLFEYASTLSVNKEYTFVLSCNKTSTARLCSLTVNDEPSLSGVQSFQCGANIYNNNGGAFGDVAGWKFTGTLHSVSIKDSVQTSESCCTASS